MSTEFSISSISMQVKTLAIPCSRCRHLQKLEFLGNDRVFIQCRYQSLEKNITEMIKLGGRCVNYSESIESLQGILKSECEEHQ